MNSLEKQIKDLEARVAKLESSQQRAYSIIANAWPGGETFHKRALTLQECQHFFTDLMEELGRAESSLGIVRVTDWSPKLWKINGVYGPNGDHLEEFQRWYAHNCREGAYFPLAWCEKFGVERTWIPPTDARYSREFIDAMEKG